MNFSGSELLARLRAPAPLDAIEAEVRALTGMVGVVNDAVIRDLSSTDTSCEALSRLRRQRLQLANWTPDRIGRGVLAFTAVELLASTVLTASALDQTRTFHAGVGDIMAQGADGLFELGRPQFQHLAMTIHRLLEWLAARPPAEVCIIESPLGNSFPTQVLATAASARGLIIPTLVWPSPRNTRPRRGRTILEAATDLAEATTRFDLLIYLDDVITGTRFSKHLDALLAKIGAQRLAATAMLFNNEPERPTHRAIRAELEARLQHQAELIGMPGDLSVVRFPRIPTFRIDDGLPLTLGSPVVWGESDLIAGKRKVNLLFTLIDHAFEVLADLAADESWSRPILEKVWQRDTLGMDYQVAPQLLQKGFREMNNRLSLGELRECLHERACEAFHQDYVGTVSDMSTADSAARMQWLEGAFVGEACKQISREEAQCVWNAIWAVTAPSVHIPGRRPQPRPDRDDSSYIIPYNPAITALNQRLVQRVVRAVSDLRGLT
jgi:hypothetical protein